MSNGPHREDNARFATQVTVVVGALALFALFAFIVLPGILGENRVPPTVPSGRLAPVATEGWLDETEAPAEKARVIPPLDPAEVMTPTPALLARGKELFAKNCVPCHGPEGRGDGPSAATLTPRPRNFTQPVGWTNGNRIGDIYKTLTGGVKGTGMVAYDYLPPKDRMALVHFVRSLGAFDHGPDDPAADAALAAQFRSAGGTVPAHIPVSLAMAKLASEAAALRPLAAPPADDPGAGLFALAVEDPARAARVLAASPAWRGDVGALAKTCADGAPANGFSVKVAELAPGEWQTLQAVLVKSAGEAKQ